MRIVLDTNIIVSACLTPEGAPATILELALAGNFTLCLSPDVLAEYRDVLMRPKFSRHTERAAVLLDGLCDIAVMVVPRDRTDVCHTDVCHDDSDNRLLECSGAAKADFFVTGNLKHFPVSFGSA